MKQATVIRNESAYEKGRNSAILANARKTFRSRYSDHEIIEATIAWGRIIDDDRNDRPTYSENFFGSLAKAYDTYGKLTEKQVEAVRRVIADRAAKKAEWASKEAALNAQRTWLGEVGEKIVVELTLKKCIEIERPSYGYYDNNVSFLLILEDADRNVVIYRGTSNAMTYIEGETVKVKATVKECGTRNGVKQTVIERPRRA